MPLGDRQENDLVHITLDVWQDKVYYLGKEYPAGYFAAGVLNASDDLIVNTVREGEFLMNAYQLARIGGREELFELLPMLWDAVKKLLEALREVPPFSLWDMEEELRKMEEMFSRNHLDKLVEDPIEREIFMIYLLGGIMILSAIPNFLSHGVPQHGADIAFHLFPAGGVKCFPGFQQAARFFHVPALFLRRFLWDKRLPKGGNPLCRDAPDLFPRPQ